MTRGRGLFLSLEGGEGSGKTTQMGLLVERLRREGYAVTRNQEPGGTEIGRQVRRILLDPVNCKMDARTELLLMFASRAQAASEIILPALERGDIVVSDRFTDSTLAYQGEARGLGFETVLAAHHLSLGDLFPDLTICLMLDVEIGLARANHRNQQFSREQSESRIDHQSVAFHRKVQEGYRRIASLEPGRVRLVDATGEPRDISERIWLEIEPAVAGRLKQPALSE